MTYSHLLPLCSSLMTGSNLKLGIADSMPSCIIIVIQEKREDTFYAINSNFIAIQFICICVRFCACVSVCMHMCLCIFNAMKSRDSPFIVILSILFSVISKELFSCSTFINFLFVVFWNMNTSRSVQTLTSIISLVKKPGLQFFSMKYNFVNKVFHLNLTNTMIMTTVHVNQIRK